MVMVVGEGWGRGGSWVRHCRLHVSVCAFTADLGSVSLPDTAFPAVNAQYIIIKVLCFSGRVAARCRTGKLCVVAKPYPL